MIIQSLIPGDIGIIAIGPVFNFPSRVNEETSLFLNLQPEVIFKRNGSLEVVFPPQFSFNMSTFKCEFILGLDLNGYCTKNGSSVFTNNTFYLSITSPIIFVIHGVINPNSTAPTDNFFLQTYDENQRAICKSYSNYTYSATPGNLSLLANPLRDKVLAGTMFTLNAKLKTTNNFPKGGFVTIEIPLEQGILNNTGVTCAVLKNSVYSNQNCVAINKTNSAEIWINEWCSTTSICTNGTSLDFQIFSSFINPYFIARYVLLIIDIFFLLKF